MRSLQIIAALAAIGVGNSAHALPPIWPIDISLVVAGSTTQRDAFRAVFTAMCQPSTLNLYKASGPQSAEFYAYSCTLITSGLPASIAGKNAIVYYRAEGGSLYGVGPMAKNLQVKRLLVNAACISATPPDFGNCPVNGYSLSTDGANASGNLINAPVDLAVSELEPQRFVGENWPSPGTSIFDTQPTAEEFQRLNSSQTWSGTVYGILVNTSVPFNDLSRQDISSIFTGQYGNWNQIATPGNTAVASQEITVCRRAQGSGTQVAASIYFNRQGCGAGYGFVTAPAAPNFENPVFELYTDSAMNTCVTLHPGSIGIQVYSALKPTGTKWVSINGVAPGKVAAALGDYDFWYESVFSTDETIASKPLPLAFAQSLMARARLVVSLPVNDSTIALFNSGTNLPQLPVRTDRPTALGTYAGGSCSQPTGVY